jgi:hypothetical protein
MDGTLSRCPSPAPRDRYRRSSSSRKVYPAVRSVLLAVGLSAAEAAMNTVGDPFTNGPTSASGNRASNRCSSPYPVGGCLGRRGTWHSRWKRSSSRQQLKTSTPLKAAWRFRVSTKHAFPRRRRGGRSRSDDHGSGRTRVPSPATFSTTRSSTEESRDETSRENARSGVGDRRTPSWDGPGRVNTRLHSHAIAGDL